MLAAVQRIEEAVRAFAAAVAAAPLEDRFGAVKRAATAALLAFAAESAVVDEFFEAVMVIAEDATVRNNRLALCYRAYLAFTKVAGLHQLDRT